jgi:tetratricopeptide (TPR) repeat protein
MKYKCIPCDHVFESKETAKPRCPRCMKIHDVEPFSVAESGPGGGRKWIVPVVVLLAVGAIVGIYLSMEDDTKESPDDVVEVSGVDEVLAEAGLSGKQAVIPFEVTKRVEEFAKKAAGNKEDLEALGMLFKAVSKMRESGKWRPHHQREPRREGPLSADELIGRLGDNGDAATRFEAYSYELACLLYSAARSLDLDVSLAEIHSFDGEKKPADPNGKLGTYGVVMNKTDPGKTGTLFDLFSGRSQDSAKGDFTRLTELEAAAPYYHLESLSLLLDRQSSKAHKSNDIAIKLDPDNPLFRVGRGLVFAASGVPAEALAEFEKAVKFSPDPATRISLAEVLLLTDPTGKRAEAEVQAALAQMPDFSRAHAVLAMIHLLRREYSEAETELALAQRLDPSSPAVAMFWAQYHVSRAHSDEAVSKALEAVRLSGRSTSNLLGLAGIYRATARFDDMRRTLDSIYKESSSDEIAREIKQIFGYDPRETEDQEETEEVGLEGDAGVGFTGDLQLKLGDDTIGGGGEEPQGSQLKLGGGLGSSLGQGRGLGLGGEKLKLNLDLNKK